MSRGNKWIPLDQYLAQEFKYIRRKFSRIEAMFSFTLDQDKGINGTISGYSKLWGWSRNKVRRFVNCIRTDEGHLKDSKRTLEGQAIHFIDKALMNKKDRQRTGKGQVEDTCHDTTIHPKPKPNNIYTSNFLLFWKSYPKKIGKGDAFKAYKNIKEPRPSLEIIFNTIEEQNKSEQWQTKKYIPNPSTWLNQRRWEDEIEPINGNQQTEKEILAAAGIGIGR